MNEQPESLRLADECEESAKAWANEVTTRQQAAAELRRLHAENEALRKDAERYLFIRSGNVYIEPNTAEIYMATDAGGKYYKDPRDMDMDIDEAISAAMQKGQP